MYQSSTASPLQILLTISFLRRLQELARSSAAAKTGEEAAASLELEELKEALLRSQQEVQKLDRWVETHVNQHTHINFQLI